jgi:hypothetical protein
VIKFGVVKCKWMIIMAEILLNIIDLVYMRTLVLAFAFGWSQWKEISHY